MDKQEFAKMVQAWANGAEIQFRHTTPERQQEWMDSASPQWSGGGYWEWRIKPKTVRWRVALMAEKGRRWTAIEDDLEDKRDLHRSGFFVRWLTDWQETEV